MANLDCIIIPSHLQRNATNVLADGVEHTGESLLRGLARRMADRTWGLDLLDIGCGLRFTQTLTNTHLASRGDSSIEHSFGVMNAEQFRVVRDVSRWSYQNQYCSASAISQSDDPPLH